MMRARILLRGITICAALAPVGCASVLSSGPTALNFISNPDGAEVWVNGKMFGHTPVLIELQADEQQIVTFRKGGCEDMTLPLQTHVQGGVVVLDVILGVVGVAVDAATGEWKEFNDKAPFAQLDCSGPAPPRTTHQGSPAAP